MNNSELTAQQIIETLGLQAHPTCGFVRESWRSSHKLPGSALPNGYDGERSMGSVLYFMVTPEARIQLHCIRPDQMYHHYIGDPLEVLLLYPDGSGAIETVGSDLFAGMQPQLFIPGGTYHMSRLRAGGVGYALLATTEYPGVEPPDVQIGDPEELMSRFPSMQDQIRQFAIKAGDVG